MALILNLFNATSLQSALELLWRTQGVRLDLDHVDLELTSVDAISSNLKITARPIALNGAIGKYSGEANFPFLKADIDLLIPEDIVFGDSYPTTFSKMKTGMFQLYGLLVEENELVQELDPTLTPLKEGSSITAVLDVNNRMHLLVTEQSKRWKAGGRIRVKITGPIS